MGTITKVVLDTNIIISAYGWGGIPGEIIRRLENNKIINNTSLILLSELKRTLAYSKLKIPKSDQSKIIESMVKNSVIVDPQTRTTVIENDPTDNRVLECALEAKADYIISGDSHLLSLKEHEGITIVTPGDFLKSFRALQDNPYQP